MDPTNGDIFVVDLHGFRVQKYDKKGHFLQSIGTPGTDASHEANGELWYPNAIAVDPTGTFLYVADTANSRIQVFSTTDGGFVRKWGTLGSADNEMSNPTSIALDAAGNLYITDHGNSRVDVYTSTGTFIRKFGEGGESLGKFYGVQGIAVNPLNDHIYVTDQRDRLQEFTPEGGFVVARGIGSDGNSFLWGPDEISIGVFDGIPFGFVIESAGGGDEGNEVSVFDLSQSGEASFIADFRGTGEPGSGFGFSPHGIYLDPETKELFVAAPGADGAKIYRYDTDAKPKLHVYGTNVNAHKGNITYSIDSDLMLGDCYVKGTGELRPPPNHPIFDENFPLRGPRAVVRVQQTLKYKIPLTDRMIKAIKETRVHVHVTFKDPDGCNNPLLEKRDDYQPVTRDDIV